MSDGALPEVVAFLATVPLLEGVPEAELEELARVLRRRELPRGRGRCGARATRRRAMPLIVDGRVSVSLRLPGDRAVEVTSMGRGEVLGEIPLLDGGRHSATARVGRAARACCAEPRRLRRARLAAPPDRLRAQAARSPASRARGCAGSSRVLAASLGAATPPTPGGREPCAELEPCGPPDSGYVRRLATFRAFDSLAALGVPDRRPLRALPGRPHADRRGGGPRRRAT